MMGTTLLDINHDSLITIQNYFNTFGSKVAFIFIPNLNTGLGFGSKIEMNTQIFTPTFKKKMKSQSPIFWV